MRRFIGICVKAAVAWAVLASPSWAGQVVTEEMRAWAKKAVAEEAALQAAPSPNSVGVLYFKNLSANSQLDPLQKGMTAMLITDLSKIERLNVVERARLQALVDEMQLGASGLAQPETVPQVGRLLRAQWLVGGDIAQGQQGPLQIGSDVIDVPATKITGEADAEGLLEELFRMEKDLLFEIIAFLKIEPTPAEEVKLREPPAANLSALMAFFAGIEASDLGSYDQAYRNYVQALKQDPEMAVAREALEELQALGLVGAETAAVAAEELEWSGGAGAAGAGAGGGQGTTLSPAVGVPVVAAVPVAGIIRVLVAEDGGDNDRVNVSPQ